MKIKILPLALLLTLILASCSTQQRLPYLQDMVPGRGYMINYQHEAIVHINDRLNITVSSKNPELAIPFNIQTGTIQVTDDGRVSPSGSGSRETVKGYWVDPQGNIDFPILGALHVDGLSLSQLSEMIKERLINENYISDPIVTAEFINFKFYALGEVGSKGAHSIEGSRINLLEALSLVGDISDNGRADRVAIIRENGNSSIVYMHDLQSKDLFDSPGYYLKQNDIIYVEPKRVKRFNEDRAIRYGTLALSTIASVLSLIVLTRNMK